MSKREGEVREVPFLGNDMKNDVPTTGKPVSTADAPGKADSELSETAPDKSKGNATINVDDASLDDNPENRI